MFFKVFFLLSCVSLFLQAEDEMKYFHPDEKAKVIEFKKMVFGSETDLKVAIKKNHKVKNRYSDKKANLVSFHHPKVGFLQFAVDLKSNNVIEVTVSSVPDPGVLPYILNFKHVRSLDFNHCGYSKTKKNPMAFWQDLAEFKDLDIDYLGLGGSRIDPKGWEVICQLKNLKALDIFHVVLKEEQLRKLEHHPNLEYLRVGTRCSDLVKENICDLFTTLPKLKVLSLNEMYLTYEVGLQELIKMKDNLIELSMRDVLIISEDFKKLKNGMPRTSIQMLLPKPDKFKRGHVKNYLKWVPKEILSQFTQN